MNLHQYNRFLAISILSDKRKAALGLDSKATLFYSKRKFIKRNYCADAGSGTVSREAMNAAFFSVIYTFILSAVI